MVLNVSGLEDTEDTEESGIMDIELENRYDSDMADVPHGPITNPRITNLFTTQRSWRVLRLPGGRAGDEGAGGLRGFGNFMLQIIPGWRGQTIRDSPFRQIITARMWQSYINNMEPIDDALEIQAPYSPEEMLSLRMFCEEWNSDPGHVQFTRRLANHPSTSASDAVLKGNMVYDLCTGQIQLRTSRGDREGNIPIRLAHDILTSIPFQEYNFYSLNSVHAQEGVAVYEQFLNRYVRLSSTEVAMVEEIENGVRASGRAYATMSTNLTGDPIEAFALMQQIVEAMEIGDTMTVRSQINALISPPYNYQSMAQQIDVAGTHGGRYVSVDNTTRARIDLTSSSHLGQSGNNGPISSTNNSRTEMIIYTQGRDVNGNLVTWPSTQPLTHAQANDIDPGFYMRVNDNGIGVHSVLEVLMVGTNKFIRTVGANDQALQISQMVGGFNARDRNARDDRAPGNVDRDAADRRRGVRGGERRPRANPEVLPNRFGASATMGRGANIYVQLHNPKTQMVFKGKQKGRSKQTQYWDRGSPAVADVTGLAKVFPGGLSGGYFLKKGGLKRTKTTEPWLIALPRKDFQAFTDSEGRRTIRPKRRKAEANPAWEKFIRYYGVPTYAGEAGKQNLFKIKKADQGTYYDKLRSKPTKK
jgi:hypothetical protein